MNGDLYRTQVVVHLIERRLELGQRRAMKIRRDCDLLFLAKIMASATKVLSSLVRRERRINKGTIHALESQKQIGPALVKQRKLQMEVLHTHPATMIA